MGKQHLNGDQFMLFPDEHSGPLHGPEQPPNYATSLVRSAAMQPTAIRTKQRDALSIMEHGFRSQHETGTTGGTYDPPQRAEMESRIFGSGEGNHPIYGFQDREHIAGSHATSSYGPVKFRMGEHVRKRTTITPDDSLWLHGDSREVIPTEESVRPLSGSSSATISDDTSNRLLKGNISEYVESQVHRGDRMDIFPVVGMGDVSSISYNPDKVEKPRAIRMKAHELGIPIYEERDERYTQGNVFEEGKGEDESLTNQAHRIASQYMTETSIQHGVRKRVLPPKGME